MSRLGQLSSELRELEAKLREGGGKSKTDRQHAGEERHVRTTEDREADDVDILLDGGRRDHLGRLVEPRVDDLHACVAQRSGDDFRASIVTIEAGLGDQNTDRTHRFKLS